ncbi:MAG: sigma-70 family RNA polymerase sigma factor [Planctomycetota bacterium]|jgi:RNA polymerase sigma factor (TIGR02999 family)
MIQKATERHILSLVTQESPYQELLLAAQGGDTVAREQIASWMMDTANRQAARALHVQKGSLSHSSLLSQILVRLVRGDTIDRAPDIYYLVAAITKATRHLLIDHYRRVESRRLANFSGSAASPWFQQVLHDQHIDEWELEDALEELSRLHPRKASVVNLRFFCEMPAIEVAQALGISKSTVESDLRLARAWLFRRLGGSQA